MSGNKQSGRLKGVKDGQTRGRILVMIKENPCTARHLTQTLGIDRGNVWKHLKKLKEELGLIYVSAWEENGTGWSPVYSVFSFGHSCKDAPKPAPKTDAELSMASYRRNRALRLQKKKAKRRKLTVWDGLLYGMAA